MTRGEPRRWRPPFELNCVKVQSNFVIFRKGSNDREKA